jgi:hypothetical protein
MPGGKAHALAWTIILRGSMSPAGLLLLGPFTGVWVGSWFSFMPRLLGRPTLTRIAGIFGLAALWVVNGCAPGCSGFPAAARGQSVAASERAADRGVHRLGVSFVLVR